MNNTKAHRFIVPLSQEAHRLAAQFAAQHLTQEKGKQVYLSILSVYAVHRYLKYLNIETNFEQSDCWKVSNQVISEIADLVLTDVGKKLECRPILPGETHLIPLETTDNLLGYVGVQFADILSKAEIIGFLPANSVANNPAIQIAISSLQPLDTMIEHIYEKEAVTKTKPKAEKSGLLNSIRNLNFVEIFQQTIQDISSEPVSYASSAYRDNIEADIPLVTEINLGSQNILLIAEITPKEEQKKRICLRLEAIDTELPQLQIFIIDESGEVFPHIELETPNQLYIKPFIARIGEVFSIKICCEDISAIEEFTVN